MSKSIFFTAVFGVLSLASSAVAEDSCYKIEGMTCATCAVTAKAAVNKLDGIQRVEVSTEDKKAKVSFDPKKTNESAIKAAIDDVGYKASIAKCTKG